MDLIRQDTAKRYRNIRKILVQGRSEHESEQVLAEDFKDKCIKVLRFVAITLCIMLMLHGCAWAMTASWYSVESLKKEGTWAYSHGRMANGHIFSDNGFTCATRLFPLGSTLRVYLDLSKTYVDVKVTDRIGKRFAHKRIDLSKAAFAKLADLNTGIIHVSVRRVQLKAKAYWEKKNNGRPSGKESQNG